MPARDLNTRLPGGSPCALPLSHCDSALNVIGRHLFLIDYLQLKYQDIRVIRLEVSSENELRSNTLHSFWEQSDVDISEGLRFQSSGKVQIRFTHLNHKPFAYRIKVNNESDVEKIGTVRIFMAPSVDEIGNPLTFPKQRLLMVEMDKFTEIRECLTLNNLQLTDL